MARSLLDRFLHAPHHHHTDLRNGDDEEGKGCCLLVERLCYLIYIYIGRHSDGPFSVGRGRVLV
jgi:hypothetical protein